MSSPYSSNLLQQSSHDAPNQTPPRPHPGVVPPQHTRLVTHVVPQMQPSQYAPVPYAPQPMYAAPVQKQGGGTAGTVVSSLVLGLIVILLGAVALIGGYYAMRSGAPTSAEANAETNLANQQGYLQGRDNGLQQGRLDGQSAVSSTSRLRSEIAAQNAYNSAYQRGLNAGSNSYHAPRYYGGYGYRGPSYGYSGGSSSVTQALGSAQAIANATGAPVDVQLFN